MLAPQSRCRQPGRNCLGASQTGERHDSKRAAEMPGCGQRGKPKPGFPSPPTSPWKSLVAISTFPQPRPRPPWESGDPKTGFPLSHSDCPYQINQKRKEINPSPKPRPSGSSQDWNMLSVAFGGGLTTNGILSDTAALMADWSAFAASRVPFVASSLGVCRR